MASVTSHNINNLNNFLDKNSFIPINEYNKLKSKYENKNKENKKLKEYLENIMKSYETINDSKKSVESIFESIKDVLKNIKILPKGKEEFSTSYTHYEFLGSLDMKTVNKSCNCNTTTLNLKDYPNPLLMRKIEEMEISFNEIYHNFSLLCKKYKIIKEEKEKLEETNLQLLQQISGLNEEYKSLYHELNECNFTIERFKEIDKCLVNSMINSLLFNCDNENNINYTNEDYGKGVDCIMCEPVPTFVKFINKFTK